MILTVHPAALRRRPAMYLFELQQQVGIAGIALACLGAAALFRRWRIALLVWSAYLPALVFAATYNVGDTHVFFLPSHYCVLLALAAGVAATLSLGRIAVPAATPGGDGDRRCRSRRSSSVARLGHAASSRSARRSTARSSG